MNRAGWLLAIAALALGGSAVAAPYALVDGAGNAVNIVEWDGSTPYAPGDGLKLQPLTPALQASYAGYAAAAAATAARACPPGSVTYNGAALVLCSLTGKSSTTMPGPIVAPLQ